MSSSLSVDITKLQTFLNKAGLATYAGDSKEEENPEKPGFKELVFNEGEYTYRDSYTGHFRSRGMEFVRINDQPIWAALYGGGMVKGQEDLASQTFEFLKKALRQKSENSVRGPKQFIQGDWEYSYKQDGDLEEFSGYEEIYYQAELVFFHRVIGGLIVS
jgi:hypothetical protein